MTFPAVTICNNNAVMMSKLLANEELRAMIYGSSDTGDSSSNDVSAFVELDGIYRLSYSLYALCRYLIITTSRPTCALCSKVMLVQSMYICCQASMFN